MKTDVVILGAGAAGMMCASVAGRRGRSVLVVDHASQPGGKILIAGGGHCNFTNTGAGPGQYVSQNPHFCKSALSRFPAGAFVEMVRAHGIAFHEREHGQLFCDRSAKQIVDMLKAECDAGKVRFELNCRIEKVSWAGSVFEVATGAGLVSAQSVVVATGGLSIPKRGATGLGYSIARQFGLKVVETVPALDGFTFTGTERVLFREISGVSIDCFIRCNGVSFREQLLFTHAGLSGPAALQASLHWNPGDPIEIDLLPGLDSFEWFMKKKKEGNRSLVRNLLAEILPSRLAERFCRLYFPSSVPLPQVSEKALEAFCKRLHAWKITPSGTVGYDKAEVTRGGVDTNELSSQTMEARKVPGLYFVGEVVDVTGWLGGYNLQWAWASGWAAGQAA